MLVPSNTYLEFWHGEPLEQKIHPALAYQTLKEEMNIGLLLLNVIVYEQDARSVVNENYLMVSVANFFFAYTLRIRASAVKR